jgi:hypothetical protein
VEWGRKQAPKSWITIEDILLLIAKGINSQWNFGTEGKEDLERGMIHLSRRWNN